MPKADRGTATSRRTLLVRAALAAPALVVPAAAPRAASSAASPKVLLRQVHDALAAVGPQVRALRSQGPHRRRLAAAVQAAIRHTAAGTKAGADAAIADLTGARALVAEFKNNARYPAARTVARVAARALPDLRAIDWHAGPPPPPRATVSVARGFGTVALRQLDSVTKTVLVSRSGDTGDVLEVGLRVTGLPPGVTAATLPAVFFAGDTAAEATVVLSTTRGVGPGPHTARCALVPPADVALGPVPAFDFALVPAGQPANPSGLPWASGVTTSSNDPAMVDQMRAFAAFRGRPIDIANVKSLGTRDARALESSILGKGPVYQALFDADIAVSQVLDFIPADPGGDGYAMALGGDFDGLWKRIGQALADYPKRRTFYVRLGHELNGTFAWGPQRDARKYVAAFRRCALILKATVPGVQIDWNWLRRPNGVSYEAAYPGDDVVDVVGMDPYGNQDGLDTPAGVAQYLSATEGASPAGPASALAWAKARGKKVGWAEWGVTVEPGVGDRDYPLYIEAMFDFLKANAEFVAYDIYFEIDASGEGRGRNHLLGPGTDAPRASQRYAELWRAG